MHSHGFSGTSKHTRMSQYERRGEKSFTVASLSYVFFIILELEPRTNLKS